MGLFGGGGYDNPSDSAMPYLNRVPGVAEGQYNPYINFGKGAARMSAPVYAQRVMNPQQAQADLMSGYTSSDSYLYNQQQLMDQQAGTAAAGGFSGTPYDQQQQAYTTSGLLSQDEQQYYNNNLQLQNAGLDAGMHYFDTGYAATNSLADILIGNLNNQASLAYQGAAWDDQMKAQKSNNMLSTMGSIGGGIVGGMYGGPAGAAAGSKAGGMI